MEKIPVHIDIVSDVVCPWCFVGKKNLEQAIGMAEGQYDITIQWHPFQLDPKIPEAGLPARPYFEQKFGSAAAVDNVYSQMKKIGENVGIHFNLGSIPKAVNTFSLHCLMQQAAVEGFQHDLGTAFFKAYFENALDLSDLDVISTVCAPFGWSKDRIQAILSDQSLRQAVEQSIRYAYSTGISGVPFFIINQRMALSGAQPPEAFMQALAQVTPATAEEAAACDMENGEC